MGDVPLYRRPNLQDVSRGRLNGRSDIPFLSNDGPEGLHHVQIRLPRLELHTGLDLHHSANPQYRILSGRVPEFNRRTTSTEGDCA
jgi:hypothetical protein